MRVEQSTVVNAECEDVWELISDPEFHARIPSISRWEVEGSKQRGLGARYLIRMAAGSAQVGGLVEQAQREQLAGKWLALSRLTVAIQPADDGPRDGGLERAWSHR